MSETVTLDLELPNEKLAETVRRKHAEGDLSLRLSGGG